jgi:2-keto-4-pentenoate hydratase/2-oxohepta-3-ene-1,7-dioic acid hydratase in catechol pathway
MRWCRFQTQNKTGYGIINESDEISEVSGGPFESYTVTGETFQLASVELLVPVIPPTFYAAGINYAEHITYSALRRGEEPALPKKADVGYRAVNALIADGQPIVIPADASDQVQYEGELVAVIGRECRNVPEEEALDYVFGYTIGNDVSERTWQKTDRTLWRAKNTDTFKPMGPWIVTGLDPESLHVKITLSGRVVGEYDVKTAIFGVAHYISEMSRYLTLMPGDVLWMGTDGETENMKDGDIVEVEISGIGTLRNPVVRKQ